MKLNSNCLDYARDPNLGVPLGPHLRRDRILFPHWWRRQFIIALIYNLRMGGEAKHKQHLQNKSTDLARYMYYDVTDLQQTKTERLRVDSFVLG